MWHMLLIFRRGSKCSKSLCGKMTKKFKYTWQIEEKTVIVACCDQSVLRNPPHTVKHGGGNARLWQPVAQEMFFYLFFLNRQKKQWLPLNISKFWQIFWNWKRRSWTFTMGDNDPKQNPQHPWLASSRNTSWSFWSSPHSPLTWTSLKVCG